MIPAAHITHWSNTVPWATREQVEQDLMLARLIVDIAAHPLLGHELVFRGGTCLHKLHLPAPLRYSEDLDYVRVTNTPIGSVLDALRDIGAAIGFDARSDIGPYPKMRYRGQFDSGQPMRVKIEINTHETSPARPLIRLPHRVDSPWWAGSADVLTFAPEELIATKLRALYQRRKGRDLFDLWLALTQMDLNPADIIACFAPYRPPSYTQTAALETLAAHVAHIGFRNDLAALVIDIPDDYSVDGAAELIRIELLARV
ncbi:MAG: nucleotidyl transferase AbiEii/AbiGii toxin family protein [Acidimicrobiales bacterium]